MTVRVGYNVTNMTIGDATLNPMKVFNVSETPATALNYVVYDQTDQYLTDAGELYAKVVSTGGEVIVRLPTAPTEGDVDAVLGLLYHSLSWWKRIG